MFRSFAMRANVWLVVVSTAFVAHLLTVVPAEGRPPIAAPVAEPIHEDAVVIEPPTPPPPRPVSVRVYRSPDVTNDVLQSALKVAEATFAAASVHIAWKVCGPSECNTPPSPAERLVRLVRSPSGGNHDPRCLGDALIAQCCLDHEIPLLTRDRDFRSFAEAAGLDLVVGQ